MAVNKTQLPLLQWRGGKRFSAPSSPIVERQPEERAVQVDPGSAAEQYSAISMESPCIDVKMPSPTFDIPGLSPAGSSATRKTVSKHRSYEDNGRSSYFTSPASDLTFRNAPKAQNLDSNLRTSPLTQSARDATDGQGWPDSRNRIQERPGSGGRNTSTTTIYSHDRSLTDDTPHRAPAVKKSRLNLLNPMSLLARRRSSQHGKLEDVSVTPLHVPAIPDFDPSIRGSIVHDFSAPRIRTPRREPEAIPAQRRPSDHGTPQSHSASSPALHSPMFKEHFQEDNNSTLQPGQTAYLHNTNLEAPSTDALPPFAQRLPTSFPSHEDASTNRATSKRNTHNDEALNNALTSTDHDSTTPSYLPKHMKSTSSRFSFQMSGQGSTTQEQILEERHREKFPHGYDQSTDTGQDDGGYDDYDFDAADGLEEGIPGINTDAHDFDDDDEFGTSDIQVQDVNLQSSQYDHTDDGYDVRGNDDTVPVKDVNSPRYESTGSQDRKDKRLSLARFHFTPQSSTLSPTSTGTGHESEPTPRDSQGFAIGVADTRYSPSHMRSSLPASDDEEIDQRKVYFEGLRISTGTDPSQNTGDTFRADTFDDAELYFDDGEFENDSFTTDVLFDEELLDDENQIRDIPAENAKRFEAAMKQNAGERPTSTGLPTRLDDSTSSKPQYAQKDRLALGEVPPQVDPVHKQSPSLTEGNLAAYHDALAMAANQAAASGRFDRQVSFSEGSAAAEDLPWSSSHSEMVSDASRYSLAAGPGAYQDDEPFPFDDDNEYEDDLMIAEANAEALENDEDGFYGQEFGFYARAYGKEQLELVNGGYFTSRGFNGVKRSHSGKANFQEPSLTPITERSEWSARNSVVSLQFHSGLPNVGQPLPSPGLNQLMESPVIEDEMTLSALLKLRRGAFGGSSTSINSMSERNIPSSSPLAQVSGYKYPPSDAHPARMSGSNHSHHASASILESEEEDDDELGERLMNMTQVTPRKTTTATTTNDVVPRTPDHGIQNNKVETPITSRKSHHSRNSSGAESVSYARDDDGRWILERRRTGDDGELEIIAREYLGSARI